MDFDVFGIKRLGATLMVCRRYKEFSGCDKISKKILKVLPYWPDKAEAALEYVKQNGPSAELERHMGFVHGAQVYYGGRAPEEKLKIVTELREEQQDWLDEAERKVSEFYLELASILEEPDKVTGKKIQYPSSVAIDSLLKEADENNGGSLSCNDMDYLWKDSLHWGIIKFSRLMREGKEKHKWYEGLEPII